MLLATFTPHCSSSHRNVDIGPAAKNYLRAPHVTTYLPKHGGYELDRVRGAILLYGSMPLALVDKYLDPEIHASEPEVRDTDSKFVPHVSNTQQFHSYDP
jgi:hypothetical protein